MLVTSAVISDLTKQYSGAYRARFLYTLEDGSIRTIGPFNCSSHDHASDLLEVNAAEVEAAAQMGYEQEIIRQTGEIKNYAYASADQICRQYLVVAMNNDVSFEAYLHLKIAMSYIDTATDSAVRLRLSLTVAQWEACKRRFDYLDGGSWKNEIDNYLSLNDGIRESIK